MSSPTDVDERIVDLEIRLAYQDRLINALDQVVRDLGDRVDALTARLDAAAATQRARRTA